jgi:NAD(P)-dependent dehydrogenase (short-subunit alcohol dehydrogenase family)
MQAMYDDIIAAHGRLDAVVANVGAGDSNGVQSITEKQFDFVFGVNVKGVLFTVQPAMSLLGRLAQPRELGTAAVFLSSEASSFITGVELFADGGMAQTG